VSRDAAPAHAQPAPTAGPGDLASARTVFLDLDGCVWFGSVLADGAAALVDDLRASGRTVAFLTNTSNSRASHVAAKLSDLGIRADPRDVVMPIDVLAEHPRLAGRPPAFVMGRPEVRAAVAEITPVTDDPDEATVVVLSRDTELTYQQLADGAHVLLRGGALLALNVDRQVPVEGGRILPGTGAIAAALTAASGVAADVVGKPSPFFFAAALRRFGAQPGTALMVGDTLDSDIAGGLAAGLRTVLVGSEGPASLHDPAPVPHHRVARLHDLRFLLRP
jgi:HAD superfamily hydrolase (TIGR01450 family)